VNAELKRVEADTGDPLADQAGVLTCREAMTAAATAKQELAHLPAGLSERHVDGSPRLLGKLEPDPATGLLLADRCSIKTVAAGRHVIDPRRDDVTAPQFAVDGEVRQREVAGATLKLQLCPDRPDMACSQRRLGTDQLALVPGLTARSWKKRRTSNDQDVRGATSVLPIGLGPRARSGTIAVPNTRSQKPVVTPKLPGKELR